MSVVANYSLVTADSADAVNVDYSTAFFDELDKKTFASATAIVPRLVEWFRPNRIVDVGCGRGVWLSAFQDAGVSSVVGIDGPWVPREALHISSDCFVERDLASSWHLDGNFDLALCLEVAEHLPRETSAHLVKELTSLATVVVFSAAIPGQGGTGHINEQWPDYWAALFASHGFVRVDGVRPLVWRDSRIAWFYQQNLYLFVAQHVVAQHEWMTKYVDRAETQELTLIHPRVLTRFMSVTGVMSMLPGMVWRSFKRRLGWK